MKNALIVRPGNQKRKSAFCLRQNRSVYLYNDAMKDSLARFKFRGDAKIIQAFERDFALPALKRHIHQIHILSSLFR
nr:hypothetical protein [Bacillus velezensis]